MYIFRSRGSGKIIPPPFYPAIQSGIPINRSNPRPRQPAVCCRFRLLPAAPGKLEFQPIPRDLFIPDRHSPSSTFPPPKAVPFIRRLPVVEVSGDIYGVPRRMARRSFLHPEMKTVLSLRHHSL